MNEIENKIILICLFITSVMYECMDLEGFGIFLKNPTLPWSFVCLKEILLQGDVSGKRGGFRVSSTQVRFLFY